MSDLATILAAAGRSKSEPLAQGVITITDTTWTVNIGGVNVTPRWLVGYVPRTGDTVQCVRVGGVWTVIGATFDAPMSTLPTPDPVAAAKVPPESPKSPPSPGGVATFSANDSGTWDYSRDAFSGYHGRDLTQGSYGGVSYAGAWFYGGPPQAKMKGRVVTKTEIRLGARRKLGQWGEPIVISLKRHTSKKRGGSFTTTGPDFDVTLPSFASARWVTLPNDWGQSLVDDGYGIGIRGGSYGGIVGVGSARSGLDPQSGLVRLTWKRNSYSQGSN